MLFTEFGLKSSSYSSVFQKIARDWNAVWDFTEEEKLVEENVLWLSAPEDVREKFIKELQDQDNWIIIGDVNLFLEA